jgi:hypothetical protein
MKTNTDHALFISPLSKATLRLAFCEKVLLRSKNKYAKAAVIRLSRISSLLETLDCLSATPSPVPSKCLEQMAAIVEGFFFYLRCVYDFLIRAYPVTQKSLPKSFHDLIKKMVDSPDLQKLLPNLHGTLLPHAAFFDTIYFRNSIKEGLIHVVIKDGKKNFYIIIENIQTKKILLNQELSTFLTWQLTWLMLTRSCQIKIK